MCDRIRAGTAPRRLAPLSRLRLAVSAFALSFSLAAPRASALDLDGVDGLSTETIASRERSGDWDRSQQLGASTVSGPGEYAPDGIRVGNYIISPEASTTLVFDDNIYLRDSNKQSDFRAETSGGIKFKSDLPRHVLDFSLDGKVVNYLEHTEQNYANVRAKLDAALHFDHAHTISANLLSEWQTEDRTDPSYPLSAQGPIDVFHNRVAVGITRDVGRLYGTLSTSAESWNYSDTTAVNGSNLDLSSNDTVRYATQLKFGYRFSPGFGFVGKVRATRDDNRGNATFESDSVGYEALAGLAFEVDPLLRWRILGGYGVRDYDDANLGNFNTALLEADVQWLPTQRLTISATVSHLISDSAGLTASGVVQSRAALRADYEIQHNIILHGGLEYRRDDYQGFYRQDDIYSFQAGIDYYFTKNWLLTFGYEYQIRDSTEAELEMHRNRFMVGAKLRF